MPGLEMAINDRGWFLCRCSTAWRRAWYCSASSPDGATRLTRWFSASPVIVAPRRGPVAGRRRAAPIDGAGPFDGVEGEGGGGVSGIGGGAGVGGAGWTGGAYVTRGAGAAGGGGCKRGPRAAAGRSWGFVKFALRGAGGGPLESGPRGKRWGCR